MEATFWILSIITVLGALFAVTLRNLVHCVLSLILFFLGIAGHYFLLRADFLGAVQILIYIGAVAVLMLFAIMLTRHVTGDEGAREVLGGKWWTGMGTAIIIAGLLWAVIRKDQLANVLPTGGVQTSVVAIGKALVADWVVPFEAMAVLLTAALIGAVVIALEEIIRRR
ncbi:MAG TPA: NADH-quinone oxidoreductase subunit J [Verrucomicrobiae bacterium]|nr:NADH-quinone oxidoreductase subunit J [Verrucomicrobiae bacterium]